MPLIDVTYEPGPGYVEGSLIEGLARAMKPTGAFAEELKRVGYDLQKPESKYHDVVWRAVLRVTARHVFPDKPYAQAEWLIGNRWLAGARETLVGKVVLGTLPLMSVPGLIDKVPRMISIGTPLMSGEILEKSDTHRLLKLKLVDLAPTAYFVAGILESTLNEKRKVKVEVVEVLERSYTIRFDW